MAGDTIPPAKRLAVALHRITRGSYYYGVAQLYGIGKGIAYHFTNCVGLLCHIRAARMAKEEQKFWYFVPVSP